MRIDLNRIMAEKVMGWKEQHKGSIIYGKESFSEWRDPNSYFSKNFMNWNPLHDIKQAMECLLKYGGAWELIMTDDGEYACNVTGKVFGGYHDNPATAIVHAIAEAIKEIEEGDDGK